MRRRAEISRIEGFSDAVFGFAVTLLVVSLEVPRTFDELLVNLRGFAGFAAAFSVLFVIWTEQNRFFRKYGLEDTLTLWLNALLLFLVVLFVYPLKFLFTWLFQSWLGGRAEEVRPGQESQLMLIYSGGYTALFLVFLLMHWRAYTRRGELGLSPVEVFDTLTSMLAMSVQIGIGLLSLVLALADRSAWAGLSFLLIGPALTIQGFWRGSQRRLLFAAAENRSE